MKRKFLVICFMVFSICALITANVFAATLTSATITITPSKTEYESGETVDFIVSLKDLQASSGILGFGAYVDYDKNLLTMNVKTVGLSEWSDATISQKTNRFATTKDTHSSNNEDVLKITFTAKNVTSDVVTSISLKKIQISNGTEITIDEVKSGAITIKPKGATETTTKPSTTPNDSDNENSPSPSTSVTPNNNNDNNYNNGNSNDNGNGSGNNNLKPNNQNSSNNLNDSSSGNNNNNVVFTPSSSNKNSNKAESSKSKIPNLGINTYIYILITIAAIIALILLIKLKLLDTKIKKQSNDIIEKDIDNKK